MPTHIAVNIKKRNKNTVIRGFRQIRPKKQCYVLHLLSTLAQSYCYHFIKNDSSNRSIFVYNILLTLYPRCTHNIHTPHADNTGEKLRRAYYYLYRLCPRDTLQYGERDTHYILIYYIFLARTKIICTYILQLGHTMDYYFGTHDIRDCYTSR